MLRLVFARRPVPPADHAPCFPDWVFLDTVVRGANHDEKLSTAQCSASLATTARTLVDVRREARVEEELLVEVEVEVSFLFATPPQVSGFIVHVGDNGLSYGAHVVSTDGDAVLLEITMAKFRPGRYFVYKAGRGSPPSLEALPYPPLDRFHPTREVGIVSHAEGYVVAAMVPNHYSGGVFNPNYELFRYSSHTRTWSTMVIPFEYTSATDLDHVCDRTTNKVIAIGGDSIGWVDLWHGILVCNVLDKDPVVRLLSLPRRMPTNACPLGTWSASARSYRDVICVGSTLRFVELEYHDDDADDDEDDEAVDCGWTATAMERTLGSDWNTCFVVDSADVLLTDQSWDLLSERLWDDDEERLSLRNCVSSAPTLGIDDGSLYIMSRAHGSDEKPMGLFAAIDMKNKDARLVSFSTERMTYVDPNYCSCTLSRYFNNTIVARENIVGENLRWIGLVKLAVLRDILAAIQTLTSLDEKLKMLERPDKAQLSVCSISIAMLNQMADGINSYTDSVSTTSIRDHVSALEVCISLVRDKASSFIDKDEYEIVDMVHIKISFVLALACSLVKALLPKGLNDPLYRLRSVDRTLEYGELPLAKYLRHLAPSEHGPKVPHPVGA